MSNRLEFLEDGTSEATTSWTKDQQARLRAFVSNSPLCAKVKHRVARQLTRPSATVPVKSGSVLAVNFRAAREELSSTFLRRGNGPLVPIAEPEECRNGMRTPFVLRFSPDARLLAIGWRIDGRDEVETEVIDVQTRTTLSIQLPSFNATRAALSADLQSVFYFEPGPKSFKLLKRRLEDPDSQVVVLQESINAPDVSSLSIQPLFGDDYLIIGIRGTAHRNVFTYMLVSTVPYSRPQTLWTAQPHRASFAAHRERLFLLTDLDAPNQQVLMYPLDRSKPFEPSVVIPEPPHPIRSIHLAGDLVLLVCVVSPWSTELRAFSLEGRPISIAHMPTDGTIEDVCGMPGERHCFVETSTVGKSPSIFKIDTEQKKCQLYFLCHSKEDMGPIKTEKTWFRSFDGTRVPIRISSREDLSTTGPAPMILTAYGGFGITETMRFTNRSSLWLSMGGVIAHAGIRGGGELGRTWHEAGMLHRKENSFDDFIAAAEWLVAQGYTTSRLLAIAGGSNAGLLVGVAMTRRPDLFGAVICSGPLLDMMRYHHFAGGTIGLPEYGSPDIQEDAEVIRRYTPYQNIEDGVAYPPALFISGAADTRCDPMHARKMVARLQQATSSDSPVLLDFRDNKGHAGLMPLNDRIDALTNQLVFLLKSLGLRLNEANLFEVDP